MGDCNVEEARIAENQRGAHLRTARRGATPWADPIDIRAAPRLDTLRLMRLIVGRGWPQIDDIHAARLGDVRAVNHSAAVALDAF